MFKICIKNIATQKLTHGAEFETLELAQAWITKLSNHPAHPWGKPERQEELLDENGLSFDPPQYQTVPSEFEIEGPFDLSLIPPSTEEIRASRIEVGRQNRQACEQVLDLIGGWNSERELSVEDIFAMQTTLANADKALRVYMPKTAKQAIQAIVPDGVLVTQEMKDDALMLLADY